VSRTSERVLDYLASTPQFAALCAGPVGGEVRVGGLWGSAPAALLAALSGHLKRPILLVCPSADEADNLVDDLGVFLAGEIGQFPAWDTEPSELEPGDEVLSDRARLVERLARSSAGAAETPAPSTGAGRGGGGGNVAQSPPSLPSPTREEGDAEGYPFSVPPVIVAPIQALMQPVPSREAVAASTRRLAAGAEEPPERLAEWLVEAGFAREAMVDLAGQFALRGGVFDLWPFALERPLRIEFFGDRIENIRFFDPITQRSTESVPAVDVSSAAMRRDEAAARQEVSLLALLPPEIVIAVVEPESVQERATSYLARLRDPRGTHSFEGLWRAFGRFGRVLLSPMPVMVSPAPAKTGSDPTEKTSRGLTPFSPAPGLGSGSPPPAAGQGQGGGAAGAAPFATPSPTLPHPEGGNQGPTPLSVNFLFGSVERFSGDVATVKRELADLCQRHAVAVFCDNAAEAQRLRELLADAPPHVAERLVAELGSLTHGFRVPEIDLVLLPNRELFHRYADRRVVKPRRRGRPIESFVELARGDYVVHVTHGIALYQGMETVDGENGREDCLVLEFADKVRLYVPANRIELVQKYVGGFERYPDLSRLGTSVWEKRKAQVKEAVTDLAAEMLRLQARRASQPGIAYPADSTWQREFEASFIYAETPDQTEAIGAIKRDMETPRPMDRLLCGDVGYGKTELAMRAAFKVVESGRQVAVLVPTTILAEQHGRTFAERMADYPVVIEVLSRFRTDGEQRRVIDRLGRGEVDVLIGTHRILQNDVEFLDLGLIIVDEEQRFGVEHKERLKRFRETVDVLTLTATPIPRTLHMSLLGIRDISSLATPPVDRLAIHTEIIAFDRERIRNAILREMNRDGQVFFVHNRVYNIDGVANMVRRIVPEARVLIGHGQMHERELARAMLDFVQHKADVLVATTIIENGLDIPAVNTIFIHEADIYGLADLHQLRGRVGRYKHRAFCYLLLPEGRPVTETAQKRLRALEEFAELGAGFKIAMRDLEIRGAGNILGTEQSGHIAAVGYDLYCRLLEQSIREMKGEPPVPETTCRIDVGVDSVIPSAYIRDDRQKMDVYRKLARTRNAADLEQLAQELRDVYGPVPEQVQILLDQAETRLLAAWRKVTLVTAQGNDLVFRTDDLEGLKTLLASAKLPVRPEDERTVHLRLWPGGTRDARQVLNFLRELLRHGRLTPR
jgi:transcription-repair coupling factor (superfamily II helicase)